MTTSIECALDVLIDNGAERLSFALRFASAMSFDLDPSIIHIECDACLLSSRFYCLGIPTRMCSRQHKLGGGGFGDVYASTLRRRAVATKVMLEQNALRMDLALERFESEIALLLALRRHACIVEFVGASHIAGRLMQCFELLSGRSVASLLDDADADDDARHRRRVVWSRRLVR